MRGKEENKSFNGIAFYEHTSKSENLVTYLHNTCEEGQDADETKNTTRVRHFSSTRTHTQGQRWDTPCRPQSWERLSGKSRVVRVKVVFFALCWIMIGLMMCLWLCHDLVDQNSVGSIDVVYLMLASCLRFLINIVNSFNSYSTFVYLTLM